MITGYPHEGAGMFEIACELVEKRLSRPVQSTIVSLGGFPAPRAEKYLKKVFDFNPQYIVIQFGATDAQCPIRARSRPNNRCSELSNDGNSESSAALRTKRTTSYFDYRDQPTTALSHLRWQLSALIGHLRKIEPVTPLSSYIASIERMVVECLSAGIKPVVLSPFVYGSRYTMRNAISYTNALHERLRAGDGILVDCVAALAKFPKSSILQHDGFHLSRAGHDLIGEAIAQAIVTDVVMGHAAIRAAG